MSSLNIWLMAARPRTLGAAIAPVIVGTAMAIEKGTWDIWVVFAAIIGALLIQVGTNLANDYFDFIKGADTAERLGPTRITQAGLAEPKTVRLAFILTFVLTLLPGFYLMYKGGVPIFILGVLSILSGIAYTGGPFPLGYNGLGDVFVLVFFGWVAVGGTYYLHTGELNFLVLLAATAPGLITMAILVVNNLRDMTTDAKVGKRTLAVRFGAQFVRYEYLFSWVIAALIPGALCFLTSFKHPFVLMASVGCLLALPIIKQVFILESDPRLNPFLGKTGKLLLVYSVLFSVGWII